VIHDQDAEVHPVMVIPAALLDAVDALVGPLAAP
jgi:hypothetical protein